MHYRRFRAGWLALFCGLTLANAAAWGAQAMVTATVEQVLTTDGLNYGGCMALLSSDPQDKLPRCGAGWVSFSCSGVFTQPAFGFRMLDQAQLALAGDKFVQVYFDDSRMHDGYCFAYRVDVIR